MKEVMAFALRVLLVISFWGFLWSVIRPQTQAMRICRAALLVLGLLGIWAVLELAAA